MDIYATTASNAIEDSFATYCPDEPGAPEVEYNTCLGDLYSISWLEDRYAIFCIIITIMYSNKLLENISLNQCAISSNEFKLNPTLFFFFFFFRYVANFWNLKTWSSDKHDLRKETLQKQYEVVNITSCECFTKTHVTNVIVKS